MVEKVANMAQQTEVTTILTNKYLSDSTIGTLSNSGYVAKNPYSQGNYFEVTPIIYDNTVDSTFTA